MDMGINRNIVECKACRQLTRYCTVLVLIETLWNVKMDTLFLTNLAVFVLIETLWNVKKGVFVFSRTLRVRINRNIVECKDASLVTTMFAFAVLIETLWNVKNYESEETEVPEPVLIETLWNVKLEH